MSTIQVKVPDIGDFAEVEVIELMVKVGDTIAKEQSLITVESDKASMEIPSSHAGVVQSISVKIGDKVKIGSVVLVITETAVAAAATPASIAPTVQNTVRAEPVEVPLVKASVPQVVASLKTSSRQTEGSAASLDVSKAHASPAIRAFARELGADLNAIKELLGHANLSATQIYTHNSIERLKDVYNKAHPKGKGE